MNLWNVKKLHMPPINTYKAEDSNIDIYHLNKVFRDGIKFFENGKYMNAEFAILSRIVYRMKQKFRSAKDFKALEKVHKAVENFVKINFSSDLTNFTKLIPTKYREDTYLPNKNLVDYFLVRLQGLVKLMERIVDSCKIAAYLFDRRMQTGHFWKVGIIIFSIVSRLYVLAKYNAKFMCEFYGKVLPFSRQLKNNGRNWLPNNYVLPADLQKWMNVDWLDIDDEVQFVDTVDLSSVTQLFDLVDDDDIEFCDEYIMVDDEEDVELISNFKSLSKMKPMQKVHEIREFDTEDIGEVIDINDEVVDVNDSTYPDQSDPRERENQSIYASTCDQGDTSDFGEVIKVDSTLHISSDGNSGNEVIILDSSLPIFKDKDDVGEVIELNSNSVLFNENRSQNDDTNEIITILDSSLDSSSTKIRCIYSSTPLSQPNKNKQNKAAKKKKNSKRKSLLSKINNKTTSNQDSRNSTVLSRTISSCDKENFASTSNRDREKNHLKYKNKKLVSNSSLIEQSKNKSLKDCSGMKNGNKAKQKLKNKVHKGIKSEQVQSHVGKKRKLEHDSEKSFKKLKNNMNAMRENTSTKKKKSDLWQSTVVSSEPKGYKSDMGKLKFGTPKRDVDNVLKHHVKKNQTNSISKKKSKSFKNKIKLAQQHNGIKNIVNKISYPTQELRRNGKKKRKNKQNRHK